jgi:hypothetical protein
MSDDDRKVRERFDRAMSGIRLATDPVSELRLLLIRVGHRPHGNRFDCVSCGGERAINILPPRGAHSDPLAHCHGCGETWSANWIKGQLGLPVRLMTREERRAIEATQRREHGLKDGYAGDMRHLERAKGVVGREHAKGVDGANYGRMAWAYQRINELEGNMRRTDEELWEYKHGRSR